LHVQRLGLDLPLRATGDADFGVPAELNETLRLYLVLSTERPEQG
jgi:hypothetical protein